MPGYKLFSALLTTCMLTGLVTFNSKTDQNRLTTRVMTYNIRYDNPDDGVNRWDNRKERVLNLIRFNKADIIGLQEAEYHQLKWLDDRLKEFDWSGVGRTDGKQEGEFSPVFFNTDRFEKLDGGTFWLSPTPGKPSKGWDAALPRIVSWVHLNEKVSGKTFYFFNTHFDHIGEDARRRSADLILRKIEEIAGGDLPVILTGDFNATPDSRPYAILTKELNDGFTSGEYPHYGPEATFMDENGPFYVGGGKGGGRIDYIFTNQKVKVLQHGIISSFRDGRFPSDHLPVVADLEF